MEFLKLVGLILGVYAAFVVLFFRFLHLMHRKEVVVVREMNHRSQ